MNISQKIYEEVCGMTEQEAEIDELAKIIDEWLSYHKIGTPEELRESREKQVPKKPYIETEKAKGLREDYDCYECPNCDSFLGHVSDCKDEHYRYNYCPNCGQAIDWSDTE